MDSEAAEPLPNHLPAIQNAGRTLSSSNEALIRQAVDCLTEVLIQLDTSDNGSDDESENSEDVGLWDVALYQAQLNLTRRRLDYGF